MLNVNNVHKFSVRGNGLIYNNAGAGILGTLKTCQEFKYRCSLDASPVGAKWNDERGLI